MKSAKQNCPRVAAHVRAALAQIQEAQNRLAEASSLLSSIVGMSADCERVLKEHDRVKALWYKIDGKRLTPKIQLDGLHSQPDPRYPCRVCASVQPVDPRQLEAFR